MIDDKAAKIKLLILDVDGVMTDGRITMNEHGEETKVFDAKDGHGIKMLIHAGIDVAIISGRQSKAVEYRGKDLGIAEIHQGIHGKESLCGELIKKRGLEKDQVCCMGDDLPDIPMFHQVGLSVAVADAVTEVRDAARFVTKNKGGKGAVRELCEIILKAQKVWPSMISQTRRNKIGFTF